MNVATATARVEGAATSGLAKTTAEQQLAAAWQEARGRLPGPPALRQAAFEQFAEKGLPHRRVEEWKYTDLRALMREAMPLAPAPVDAAKRTTERGAMLAGVDARRLVIVNGVFVRELSDLSSLEAGLTITSLADALAGGDAATLDRPGAIGPARGDIAYALNMAFMGDGVVIDVAPGAEIVRPIHLVFTYEAERAGAVFSRSLVTVGARARMTLVESHEGPDGLDYQINNAVDLRVADGAEVEQIKVVGDGRRALHIGTLVAAVGEHCRYRHFTFLSGGAVVRNQLFVTCAGSGSTVALGGANLLNGRQHADTTLVVDHAAGGCESRETYKSVVDDEGRNVFQGKIVVRPGAQRTDARMLSNALLLSPAAEADNKPELEIFADDVQCGHGATAGALDEDLKFYLMARGISAQEAETLLIQSFVGAAIEAVAHERARDALMDLTERWLRARKKTA